VKCRRSSKVSWTGVRRLLTINRAILTHGAKNARSLKQVRTTNMGDRFVPRDR
jgi:hypothetical protein